MKSKQMWKPSRGIVAAAVLAMILALVVTADAGRFPRGKPGQVQNGQLVNGPPWIPTATTDNNKNVNPPPAIDDKNYAYPTVLVPTYYPKNLPDPADFKTGGPTGVNTYLVAGQPIPFPRMNYVPNGPPNWPKAASYTKDKTWDGNGKYWRVYADLQFQELNKKRKPLNKYTLQDVLLPGNTKPDQYEIHHILPQSWSGPNDWCNLVPVRRDNPTNTQPANTSASPPSG